MKQFKLSIEWIENYYAMFNAQYFENKLPKCIDFQIVNKKVNYLGKATNKFPDPFLITLNGYYKLLELEWCNTLLHEMIHIWQFVTLENSGHGKSFKDKAKEINIYGWDITTTAKYLSYE